MRPQGSPGFSLVDMLSPDTLVPSIWEQKQETDLNRYFNAVDDGAAAENQRKVDLNKWFIYRTIRGGGPGELCKFYSKRAWKHGFFVMSARLATRCSTYQIFGAEAGGGGQSTFSCFMLSDARFYVAFGGHENYARIFLNMETHLPATYNSASHTYVIKLNQNNIMAFIDAKLVAVCLLGPPTAGLAVNVQPYCLCSVASQYSDANLFFGLEGSGVHVEVGPLYQNSPYAVDGSPITPLHLRMRTNNTLTEWTGLATAAQITSHPIPIWGYTNKTLFFQTNRAGILQVQAYLGGDWTTVDTPTLTSNKLLAYPVEFNAPYARCVYTPSATDTIAVAEWGLS